MSRDSRGLRRAPGRIIVRTSGLFRDHQGLFQAWDSQPFGRDSCNLPEGGRTTLSPLFLHEKFCHTVPFFSVALKREKCRDLHSLSGDCLGKPLALDVQHAVSFHSSDCSPSGSAATWRPENPFGELTGFSAVPW